MTLKKLTNDHYIIVDDSKINNGDVHFDFDKNEIDIWEGNLHSNRFKCKKITHSTQPLESMNHGNYSSNVYLDIEKLSLQEVKELIGEVDVEKNMWYERNVKNPYPSDSPSHTGFKKGFELGYNQALEDNKDKKYTEEDLRKMFDMSEGLSSFNDTDDNKFKYALKHIQPKTEWEVEFIDEKLKLKS